MKIRRVLAGGMFAMGAAALGLGFTVGSASAHGSGYTKTCNGYDVSGHDYPEGAHVKLVVDGGTVLDMNFTPGYARTGSWDPTKSHKISLNVTSPDHIGEVAWLATQLPCEGTTTTTVAKTTTTVPPTTTVPTTTTVTMPAVPVPPTPPTTVGPTVDSTPQITNPTIAVPTTLVRVLPPTAASLPATGSAAAGIVITGVAALLISILLLVASRQGSAK